MTLQEKNREIRAQLAKVVGEREAYWMARDIIEDVMSYSEVDIIVKGNDELSDFILSKIDAIVQRVKNGEPLQQVLGWAMFCGNRFKVTRETLIPRPETQELVDIIVNRHKEAKDLRIIDIGTGTGCIAISLARALKFPIVNAIDISQETLDVACENARKLKANVNFECRDALILKKRPNELYNIIVSNPPYIVDRERDEMESVVLDYEPQRALFVPEDDPLKFYRAIAEWGKEVLFSGGCVYFEINPLFVTEMVDMMQLIGYYDVEVMKDMQGRDRMLCAKYTK